MPACEVPEQLHHHQHRRDLKALLSSLTDAQAEAVSSAASPLCVVAGAGAGKTRVLTRRIAYRCFSGDADPAHVLALTFTRKAAGEMSDRLIDLGLRETTVAGTFHSVAAAQLRRWWSDRGRVHPVLLKSKSRLLGELATERSNLKGVPVGELAGHIEWAHARLVPPADFEEVARGAMRSSVADLGAVSSLYQRYEHEKVRRGLVDFDDLLACCADAIESDPAFAAAQRWRWRHVFVDEFQDINPLQHRLLLAWLGESTDLCLVGDPNQAIYGWNGADPGLLDAVTKRWPGATVLELSTNHRCTPEIVEAASRALGTSGSSLGSSRPPGQRVRVSGYQSERAEAAAVASEMRRAHAEGHSWREMAALTRTNIQLVTLQEACRAASVPTRLLGLDALTGHAAVKSAIADLRSRPSVRLQAVIADLEESARARPAGHDEERASLTLLARLARTFERLDPNGSAEGFLRWLPTALADEDGGHEEAVTLCSFHRAKGLEWSAVWVCGVELGLVPIARATSRMGRAEERRLLYVALTRARNELHITWAARRLAGGRAIPREPSPWLSCIDEGAGNVSPSGIDGIEGIEEPEIFGDGQSTGSERWRKRFRKERERLSRSRLSGSPLGRSPLDEAAHRGDEPDPELVSKLQDWRTRSARAWGIPARVLLHDSTLIALARMKPADLEGLARVPGIGRVKAERYQESMLPLLSSSKQA